MDSVVWQSGGRASTQRGSTGSAASASCRNICATWFQSPIKSVAAAREREVVVAAAGATSNTAIVPHVLNTLLGTRFRVIAGYDPGAGLNLALESREVEGICGLSWSTLKASRPDWIREQKLNVILQMAFDKLPELADVPSALDLVSDATDRQILELILIRQENGPALRGAARRSGRSRRGAARGFRRHHERPGIPDRGAAPAARDRTR